MLFGSASETTSEKNRLLISKFGPFSGMKGIKRNKTLAQYNPAGIPIHEGILSNISEMFKNPMGYFIKTAKASHNKFKGKIGDRQLQLGDKIVFENYHNYNLKHPKGDWVASNLLFCGKNSENIDLFIGLGTGLKGKTEVEIQAIFCNEHNKKSKVTIQLEKNQHRMYAQQRPKALFSEFGVKDQITTDDLPDYNQASAFSFDIGRLLELLNLKATEVAQHITCYLEDDTASTHGVILLNSNSSNPKLISVLKKYQTSKDKNELPATEKALRRAAHSGTEEDVKFLINHIKDINAIDDNPELGRTALHWAYIKDRKIIQDLLIKAGASNTIKDLKEGKTPNEYGSSANSLKNHLKY